MPQQGGINAPYTRLRGPVLVGQSSDFGIAAVNGSSTAPLCSYWNASEHGMFVVSSAQTRCVVPGGITMVTYTSGGIAVGASTGFLSSATNSGAVYIPQTTYGVSSSSSDAGIDPPAINLGAALIFDSARRKISVFSTVVGEWLSVTLSSS